MSNHYRPPTPGRALVMAAGVETLAGRGLKGGGILAGETLSIGQTHTRFLRFDGVITARVHEDLRINRGVIVDHARDELGYVPWQYPQELGWQSMSWTVDEHIAYDKAHPAPPLVIVGCGAQKASQAQRADKLYRSTYHRLALAAARKLVPADRIRILSARHGLLPVYAEVEPYDLRLGSSGSITAKALRSQAARTFINDVEKVVVLAGRDYCDLAMTVWAHAHRALDGTRGIGDQQQRLRRIADGDVTLSQVAA